MELNYVIDVLEKSLEKHGETQLTNKWLLNILKIAQKKAEQDEIPLWTWDEAPF